MSDWIDGLPDWWDHLRKAEVEMNDGRTIAGRLDYRASKISDGLPTFSVITDTGDVIAIADGKRFRLL